MNSLFRFTRGLTLATSLCLSLFALSTSTASEMVSSLAAGKDRKVVVYGTSLTAGGGWVGQMRDWLTEAYPGKLTLVNSGLSGKNSATGLSELARKVLAHEPDTVFIEFGVNDAFRYSNGTPQLSVEQARGNLIAMIDQILARKPATEIILQTMNSAWNSPKGKNESATLRPDLADFYQMYREVAKERGLLLIDHHRNWQALQDSDPAKYKAYIPDGVHPTPAGTEAIMMPLLETRLVNP